MTYDTPFYDGNPIFGDKDLPDYYVCIEGVRCDNQTSINYVAQGAYSAAAGETLDETLERINKWNRIMYKHPASEGESFWTIYGYNLIPKTE